LTNKSPTNQQVAGILDQIAELLEAQDDNPHRIRAYRQAASSVRESNEPVAKIYKMSGEEGLQSLPGIGETLARIIGNFVRTGQSEMLQRLQGEITPEDLFTQVPGIGTELSKRIVDQLNIQTLAELELAAHDGRLEKVEGFGERRSGAIKHSLAGMLSPSAQRRAMEESSEQEQKASSRPEVSLLLEIDREYREKSEAGQLRLIAPKRFNPENKAWLPVMNIDKEGWSFSVLYSNTKRAHDLDKTHDWVVIYYKRDGEEKQVTIVTETSGKLKDKRVVRGREAESWEFYNR
jgi:ribosomal protein S13